MAIVERYIPDVMSSVVDSIDLSDITGIDNVFYDFGNYIEITNKLSKENKRNLKYPLFALILDVKENSDNNKIVYKSCDFKMIIAYNTEKNYTSQERKENIFKPILHKLYKKLIDTIILNENGDFVISDNFVNNNKTDLYFMGSQSPNQNQFNDYVDAIEIEFRGLRLRKVTC